MMKRNLLSETIHLIIFTLIVPILFSCQTGTQATEDATKFQKVQHPEWSKNLSIYEVNIRQFTPEGTINAFAEHLPRLKELGTDILWLMPIYPIGEKNRKATQTTLVEEIEDPKEREKYLGSYYSIKDYLSVNPEFGTMEDFKNLVEKIHELDMYIILDIAANHTAWDHKWITEHPDYYTRIEKGMTPWKSEWINEHPNFYSYLQEHGLTYPIHPNETDWWDTADLNFENEDLRKEFLEIFKFWVTEMGIDGYRCDVADWVPTDFWNEVRYELDKIKPVFMLAEANTPELHEYAFDMTYDWESHHLWNSIAKGEKTIDDLIAQFDVEKSRYNSSDFRMVFTSNHDENSWNGTVFERMGDAAKVFAVYSVTTPGMPLIYSGQEACMDKRLRFFEKDTINWSKDCDFSKIYSTLLKLKKKNPALWNGDFGGTMKRLATTADDKIFAFARKKNNNQVIAILNLSNEKVDFELSESVGESQLTELFTSESITNKYSLEGWEYKVFKNE